ncbi:MAG: hypothetical protein WCJ02_07735 [bacterium]
MNDVHFDVEAVKDYGLRMAVVGREIAGLMDQIERSVHEVHGVWNDESMAQVEEQVKQVKKGIMHSLEILQNQVKQKVARQLDWANRYSRIRM